MVVKSETQDQLIFYGQKSESFGWAVKLLEWTTITAEVFLRRDFGERHLTRFKLVMGLIMLGVVQVLSKIGSGLGSLASRPRMPIFGPEAGWATPPSPAPEISAMAVVTILYLLLGGYHSFRIWWRNGTGRPLHSYDHGLTWLEPVAALVLAVPNFLIGLLVKLYALALPEQERPWLLNALPFLRDARSFAEQFLEPFVLIALCLVFSALKVPGVPTWLFLSAVSLVLFTTIRHEGLRNYWLDVRDGMIESEVLREAVRGDTESLRVPYGAKKAIFEVATLAERSPEALGRIREARPSIVEAMEALHPKLKGMAGSKGEAAAEPEPPPSPKEMRADGGLSVDEAMKKQKDGK